MTAFITATDALCAQTDPELFFAQDPYHFKERTNSAYIDSTIAKNICAKCPLTLSCLMTALDNKEEYGIWGGSMPRERRYIRTKEQAQEFVNKLRARYLTLAKRRRR